MKESRQDTVICVLGATGYVGGRLVTHLLEKGWRVRAVGRSAAKLGCRPYASHERCELVEADLFDTKSLQSALKDCHAAYYLVHSMEGRGDFAEKDRLAARNMVDAAEKAGLDRIIYLGGIIPDDPNISHHLQSRAEVGEILAGGKVPCTIFRAGLILGSGSASFEMLRYLADRLPVMVTPKWVRTESQPISIRDVLFYLTGCLEHSQTIGDAFDIGGPHVETYEGLFRIYEQEAGLKRRLIIPVPFFSLTLSSYWLGLISPVPVPLARPLLLGLRNKIICTDKKIQDILPRELSDARTTIRRALEKIEQELVDTCWSDAGALDHPEWVACGDAGYAGGKVYESSFHIVLKGCLEELWEKVVSIGGDTGWYCCDSLWAIRGTVDTLFGGVGARRGRRHPTELQIGDALDFWRVLDIQPLQRILLLAEMRLPGQALLEISIEESGDGNTELTMRSRFFPRGLSGISYWLLSSSLHKLVFRRMLQALAKSTKCTIVNGPIHGARQSNGCGTQSRGK